MKEHMEASLEFKGAIRAFPSPDVTDNAKRPQAGKQVLLGRPIFFDQKMEKFKVKNWSA